MKRDLEFMKMRSFRFFMKIFFLGKVYEKIDLRNLG